jgi:hypothetical protein
MNIPDEDHVLTEGAGWFDVKGFAIRIHRTDEGVVVDIFDSRLLATGEIDDSLMASTYAFDDDIAEPGDEVDVPQELT